MRKQVLDAAGWRCEKCGVAGRLEVHHLLPLHRPGGEALALDPANLSVRCGECHHAEHRPEESPEVAAWRELVREMLDEAPVAPQAPHRPVEVLFRQPAGDDHRAEQVDAAP